MCENNQIVLIGRAANDIHQTMVNLEGGQKVAEVKLAVNRPNQQAGKVITDFVSCKFWNRQAEILAEYVKKGDLISIVGALRIDSYEVEGHTRHKYYILGENFQMLGNRKIA